MSPAAKRTTGRPCGVSRPPRRAGRSPGARQNSVSLPNRCIPSAPIRNKKRSIWCYLDRTLPNVEPPWRLSSVKRPVPFPVRRSGRRDQQTLSAPRGSDGETPWCARTDRSPCSTPPACSFAFANTTARARGAGDAEHPSGGVTDRRVRRLARHRVSVQGSVDRAVALTPSKATHLEGRLLNGDRSWRSKALLDRGRSLRPRPSGEDGRCPHDGVRALEQGRLRAPNRPVPEPHGSGSRPSARSAGDALCAGGIGVKRTQERVRASTGPLAEAPPRFRSGRDSGRRRGVAGAAGTAPTRAATCRRALRLNNGFFGPQRALTLAFGAVADPLSSSRPPRENCSGPGPRAGGQDRCAASCTKSARASSHARWPTPLPGAGPRLSPRPWGTCISGHVVPTTVAGTGSPRRSCNAVGGACRQRPRSGSTTPGRNLGSSSPPRPTIIFWPRSSATLRHCAKKSGSGASPWCLTAGLEPEGLCARVAIRASTS